MGTVKLPTPDEPSGTAKVKESAVCCAAGLAVMERLEIWALAGPPSRVKWIKGATVGSGMDVVLVGVGVGFGVGEAVGLVVGVLGGDVTDGVAVEGGGVESEMAKFTLSTSSSNVPPPCHHQSSPMPESKVMG